MVVATVNLPFPSALRQHEAFFFIANLVRRCFFQPRAISANGGFTDAIKFARVALRTQEGGSPHLQGCGQRVDELGQALRFDAAIVKDVVVAQD